MFEGVDDMWCTSQQFLVRVLEGGAFFFFFLSHGGRQRINIK